MILKNRKLFTAILYIAILALAFSWMLGLFGGNKDNLTYSQIVNLFYQQQVKSFLVDGETIYMVLNTPYNGKTEVEGQLADPEGFRQDMWQILQEQSQSGVLESYNFIAKKGTSPYAYVLPIILAGLILLLVWMFLVGRANQNNPMANFGKARTVLGQTGGKKITFDDVAGVDEEKAEQIGRAV